MEITFRFTTTSSHWEPYSPYHFGPYQDSGVGTHTSKYLPSAPFGSIPGHRRVLHSVFDPRLSGPPTGYHRRRWNCYSDMEGTMGCYRSGKLVG